MFLLMRPHPQTSTLFTYTTLFRSDDGVYSWTFPMGNAKLGGIAAEDIGKVAYGIIKAGQQYVGKRVGITGENLTLVEMRSEEHTSELQSQSNLVCRLLLEKKNTECSESVIDRSLVASLLACPLILLFSAFSPFFFC